MTFTLFKQTRAALLLAIVSCLFSCQQADEKQEAREVPADTTVAVAETKTAARPAPDFFIIPPDMAGTRVWICVDETSDIFHTEHSCPVLTQCKGTFRNVTLVRAIEHFGRYNCQECSAHLDHIFDEDMVR